MTDPLPYPACPRCAGLLRREPAAVCCSACGDRTEVIDADEAARLAQRLLDWWLRPRSIETWPAFQGLVPPRPVDLRLPGAPIVKRSRQQRRATSTV